MSTPTPPPLPELLLVNFGGVDQTDDDRARAEQIAER